ncbi:ornithine cyclodeaminase family protein [Salipiger bermudensis]|uniref:ornithine cyclodeaminase family protein n=1 Tax=Salipiger bermudensis TaxID=344736 RepID=UPI001C99A697|nr:ornithine cyclodeaminase family protein [Salipiger bermudensis]MBY6005255.1 ornithine cyclodeaminase family protein [Salipiger bermudensis]
MTALIGHQAIETALDWRTLISELRAWYRAGNVEAPERQVLSMAQPDGSEASLLIMPAWVPGEGIGVKVVTFFPGNADKGRATINAGFLLFDGDTGQMTAALDGDALTARRTAAASALAASYLARRDAKRLLVIGTGQLAAATAEAHASVRAYDEITVWGRTADKAEALVRRLCDKGLPARSSVDIEAACRAADVVTTVTASTRPVVQGAWLKPGCHLDLIGAFKSDMRESDDRAVMQAQLFVDRREGASLAGDLSQPLAEGKIASSDLLADLQELCQGAHPGRRDDAAFTVFKSVGMALQDLAAAKLAASQTISG